MDDAAIMQAHFPVELREGIDVAEADEAVQGLKKKSTNLCEGDNEHTSCAAQADCCGDKTEDGVR